MRDAPGIWGTLLNHSRSRGWPASRDAPQGTAANLASTLNLFKCQKAKPLDTSPLKTLKKTGKKHRLPRRLLGSLAGNWRSDRRLKMQIGGSPDERIAILSGSSCSWRSPASEVYRSDTMMCRVRAEAALDTQGSTPLYSGPFEASSCYHLTDKVQFPAFLLTGRRLNNESRPRLESQGREP